jgi:DNA excision repair protein ERCC-4
MTAKPATLCCPFTVVVDTREQRPYQFEGIRADANDGRRPLRVPVESVTLESGDYSVKGYEDLVAVERKSLDDLYGTLGQGRERFERELVRLNSMWYAAVMVEADWQTVLASPPERSQLNPLTVFRSVVAWQQRCPTVHWWFVPDRSFAERATFRILQRFWLEREKGNFPCPTQRLPRS